MGIPTFYGVLLKKFRFPQLPLKIMHPMHFKSNPTLHGVKLGGCSILVAIFENEANILRRPKMKS